MSHLYLLRLGVSDLYKIGISAKPATRLAGISAGEPWGQIQIIGIWPNCSALERKLHRRFAAKRQAPKGLPKSGRTEWFRLTRADVEAIRTECRLWEIREEGKADAHARL